MWEMIRESRSGVTTESDARRRQSRGMDVGGGLGGGRVADDDEEENAGRYLHQAQYVSPSRFKVLQPMSRISYRSSQPGSEEVSTAGHEGDVCAKISQSTVH